MATSSQPATTPASVGSPIVRRAGWAVERAGAASMVYNLHEHRRTQMLRLAAAYGVMA